MMRLFVRSTEVAPIDAELAAIQGEMREPGSACWRHPGRQSRYGQLLEAKQSGAPTPAGPAAEVREKADLKRQMADRGSAYSKSPDRQARYAELVEAEAARAEAVAPAEAAELPIMRLAEWQKAGHDQAHYPTYLKVTGVAWDVLGRVPDEGRQEVAGHQRLNEVEVDRDQIVCGHIP
jgi:hypothetical protein